MRFAVVRHAGQSHTASGQLADTCLQPLETILGHVQINFFDIVATRDEELKSVRRGANRQAARMKQLCVPPPAHPSHASVSITIFLADWNISFLPTRQARLCQGSAFYRKMSDLARSYRSSQGYSWQRFIFIALRNNGSKYIVREPLRGHCTFSAGRFQGMCVSYTRLWRVE